VKWKRIICVTVTMLMMNEQATIEKELQRTQENKDNASPGKKGKGWEKYKKNNKEKSLLRTAKPPT